MTAKRPTSADFTIGQTVYVEPSRNAHRGERFEPKPCAVTKLGRRWVTIRRPDLHYEERFDPATMQTDGGDYSQHAQPVWLSLQEWRDDVEASDAWSAFKDAMRHQHDLPRGLTAAEVRGWTHRIREAQSTTQPED